MEELLSVSRLLLLLLVRSYVERLLARLKMGGATPLGVSGGEEGDFWLHEVEGVKKGTLL